MKWLANTRPSGFGRVIRARTAVAKGLAIDCSVAIDTNSYSISESLARTQDDVDCCGSVLCPIARAASIILIAATPKTPTEIAVAHTGVVAPLSKNVFTRPSTIINRHQLLISAQSIVPFYRCLERSLASVLLPKQRPPSPLTPNL